jgi:hypothetical protein
MQSADRTEPSLENKLTAATPEEPAPVIESINRIEDLVIKPHVDEEQLDPASFRLDQSDLDMPVAKTVLTAIACHRPDPQDFIRTHPDPGFRTGPVPIIGLKQSREFYIAQPALRRQLRPREYFIGEIFLAITRLEKLFFWVVKLQSSTGRIFDWYLSEHACAERAMREWVQVHADMAAGVYTVSLAEEPLEEPEWPEQDFKSLFDLGFKRRMVKDLTHPVFKQLRGRAS